MTDRYVDERGVIQDLLGPVDAVTQIWTRAGCVRGNHVHEATAQWTFVVSGRMTFAWAEGAAVRTREAGPGVLIEEKAGVPHAWKAVEDTLVLVFTRGPRSGEGYEEDTARLKVPILT